MGAMVTVAAALAIAVFAPTDGTALVERRADVRARDSAPSPHFDDWRAHRTRRLAFEPGGPVSVPLSVTGRGTQHLSSTRPEVFGYLPYWELHDDDTRVRFGLVTTLAYFGVVARGNGTLATHSATGRPRTEWSGWLSSRMTTLIDRAHRKGSRVVLTVQRFSWDDDGERATVRLLSDPARRVSLASAIAAAVSDRGVDGVNLDFEPIPDGQREAYVTFVRELRTALDAESRDYQLTFAATRRRWLAGYDIGALTAEGAADAVFLMGYDYRLPTSTDAGSHAPLDRYVVVEAAGSDTSPPPDTSDDLRQTLDVYLSLTAPDKVILGSPYYGRAWSTIDGSLHSRTRASGSRFGSSVSVRYDSAARLAERHGRRYDRFEKSAWTTYRYRACGACPLTDRQVYFDDAKSLGRKFDFAMGIGLRGIGIWALGYDGRRTELRDALLRRTHP